LSNFALTGVAGYIAPRHLKAIKDTGNTLVAVTDPHDSVGILDGYFPDVSYFREFERFDRHLEKLRRGPDERRVNYVSICSPNHLHDAHIRLALRIDADAICEKPIVLNPWNLDALAELEAESGRRIWTVLQLRVHPALIAFKERLDRESLIDNRESLIDNSEAGADKQESLIESRESEIGPPKAEGDGAVAAQDELKGEGLVDHDANRKMKEAPPTDSNPRFPIPDSRLTIPDSRLSISRHRRYQVELTYITTRGLWYDYSWKGDPEKSGGIATNIGVHFFDLLLWWFGYVRHSTVTLREPRRMAGELELADADVRWFLSLEREDLPPEARNGGRSTYRSITVDGEEVEFTGGFTDLHTEVYRRILAGQGFGIGDAYPSIQLVHNLRT